MADKIARVLSNSNAFSKSTYIMKKHSDGRLPDRTKPATPADKKIHISHIIDSGDYNLRHEHDHAEEMAFDVSRFRKEDPALLERYIRNILGVMNPVYKKMGLIIKEK